MLVIHPQHDQIIDVRDVDAQVQRYLAADGHVSYVRDHCSEHISLMLLSAPLALNWLKNQFRGTGTSNAQNIPVFSIALSAKAIRGYLSILATMLRAVLARPLGPTTARSQHRI